MGLILGGLGATTAYMGREWTEDELKLKKMVRCGFGCLMLWLLTLMVDDRGLRMRRRQGLVGRRNGSRIYLM
jgi:hypothetical protein